MKEKRAVSGLFMLAALLIVGGTAHPQELTSFRTSPEGGGAIDCLALSPDGKYLALGYRRRDNAVAIWETATGKEIATLRGHDRWILVVGFSPDGKLLASGSADGTVKLWNVATWKEHASLPSPSGSGGVTSLAFSADGALLAFGDTGGGVRVWDVRTGKERQAFHGPEEGVRAVALSPDNKVLLAGTNRGTIILWEMETRKVRAVLKAGGDNSQIATMALSPDGKMLASVTKLPECRLQLWDVETGKARASTKAWSDALKFSPDGKTLAVAATGSLFLFDAATFKPLSVMRIDKGHIFGLDYSSDSKFIVTGCNQGYVKVWDVAKILEQKAPFDLPKDPAP
jgi:WD40 repeat protein